MTLEVKCPHCKDVPSHENYCKCKYFRVYYYFNPTDNINFKSSFRIHFETTTLYVTAVIEPNYNNEELYIKFANKFDPPNQNILNPIILIKSYPIPKSKYVISKPKLINIINQYQKILLLK